MPHDPPSRPPASGDDAPEARKRPWAAPALEELPPLTDLTLNTEGEPIEGSGDTSGGGSTVF